MPHVNGDVSRAAAKAGNGDGLALPLLPGLPDSVTRKQLIQAQQFHTSLQPLYVRVNDFKNGDITHGI